MKNIIAIVISAFLTCPLQDSLAKSPNVEIEVTSVDAMDRVRVKIRTWSHDTRGACMGDAWIENNNSKAIKLKYSYWNFNQKKYKTVHIAGFGTYSIYSDKKLSGDACNHINNDYSPVELVGAWFAQ